MNDLDKLEAELNISRIETNIKELKFKILKNLKANEVFEQAIKDQQQLLAANKEALKE